MTEGPDTYARLRDFLTSHMRMAHIYQPVMLKALIRVTAKPVFVALQQLSSPEIKRSSYEEITKRMPGWVLHDHGLAERETDGYRLTLWSRITEGHAASRRDERVSASRSIATRLARGRKNLNPSCVRCRSRATPCDAWRPNSTSGK